MAKFNRQGAQPAGRPSSNPNKDNAELRALRSIVDERAENIQSLHERVSQLEKFISELEFEEEIKDESKTASKSSGKTATKTSNKSSK